MAIKKIKQLEKLRVDDRATFKFEDGSAISGRVLRGWYPAQETRLGLGHRSSVTVRHRDATFVSGEREISDFKVGTRVAGHHVQAFRGQGVVIKRDSSKANLFYQPGKTAAQVKWDNGNTEWIMDSGIREVVEPKFAVGDFVVLVQEDPWIRKGEIGTVAPPKTGAPQAFEKDGVYVQWSSGRSLWARASWLRPADSALHKNLQKSLNCIFDTSPSTREAVDRIKKMLENL